MTGCWSAPAADINTVGEHELQGLNVGSLNTALGAAQTTASLDRRPAFDVKAHSLSQVARVHRPDNGSALNISSKWAQLEHLGNRSHPVVVQEG